MAINKKTFDDELINKLRKGKFGSYIDVSMELSNSMFDLAVAMNKAGESGVSKDTAALLVMLNNLGQIINTQNIILALANSSDIQLVGGLKIQ